MSFRNRFSFLSLMTIFVFVTSTVMTVPVYADESTPPVDTPESTEPVEPPAQTEAGEDTPLTQPEPESAQSILGEVPEGTDVVVLNSEGETLPLASQEAAEVLANGDPIWCPAGVAKPVAGMGGCTTPGPANVNYDPTSLGSLLAYLTANQPNKDGTIWIASNYNFANDNAAINFDGITLTVMSNFKLTLKGGWCDGTDLTCAGLVDITKPSTFDVPLLITNWNNDITISNITIANTASGANALQVSTTKNITLTNVISNNNTGRGAFFDNCQFSVSACLGSGNVTITNSQFNNNTGDRGLWVESSGILTLKDITASFNANGYGAYLVNSGALTAKAVTISGTNTFNNNGTSSAGSGLYVTSLGAITVNNVNASNNGNGGFGHGADLNNNNGGSTAGVTLTGMNIFSGNQGNGLTVASFGAIKASNLYANSNVNMGASFNNSTVATTTQFVTLTGTNEFKYNGVYGLTIQSRGQISLNNITANNNGQTGVSLNNTLGVPPSTMGVTISGTNMFKTNGYSGLVIQTNGTVTLNNMTAEGNGTSNTTGAGVSVNNGNNASLANVTISGFNSFNDNYDAGLSIISSGMVTLNNVTANNSERGYGVYINNTASSDTKPKAVTLNGTNIFNNNYFNGLHVDSYGAITTNNLTANDNGQGLVVAGTLGSGVDLDNGSGPIAQKVTLKGLNSFNDNYESGLLIATDGAILTNAITASGNGGNGVSLTNSGGTATSTVTMTGTNLITANNFDNLLIQTASTVLLNNVTASSSITGIGANISNTGGVAKAVTLNGANTFNSNFSIGLLISSNGLITVNNLTASNNSGSHGAYLSNAGSSTKAGLTLNGTNVFNSNTAGVGLYLYTLGNVKTNSITANLNGGYGVRVDVTNGIPIGSVTMNGANNFNGNIGNNLMIFAPGAVTLNSMNSTGSATGDGVEVNNTISGVAMPKPVTLTGTNVFSGNAGTGLKINSYGMITTNNITASNNMANGSNFVNSGGDKPAGVNILGTNFFDSNASTGLSVQSDGLIKTNNLTANNSSGYGATLQNPTSAAGVIMTGANSFSGNSNTGLDVFTLGAITISNLSSSGNTGGLGANLNNTIGGDAAPKAITLSGSNTFTYNNAHGLVINTYGNVTINNVTASYNGQGLSLGAGVEINSYYGNSSVANVVTLTGNNTFIDNLHAGLYVNSFGAIKANNLTSISNGDASSVVLSNSFALTGASGVTLTGLNKFTDNSGDGLNINSKGAVTLNSVNASDNGNQGLYINNTGGTGGVTLTGTNTFISNTADGLRITTNGAIKANNVTASNNVNGNGAFILNSGAATPMGVTFTGTNVFNNNTTQDGLYIQSLGAITLNNVTANGNLEGAYLNNNTGTASVTLTGTNTFNNNTNDGLNVQSDGVVNLMRITGDDNGGDGLSVGTTGPVTLTCGSFNLNGLYGWAISASTLTIKGVFTAGNGSGDFINTSGTTVTVRNCPLP